MAEHEGDLLALAQVGDPVPGEHALDADHQAVAKGRDGLEQRFWAAGQVPVEDGVAVLVENADVHAPGMQVDAAVESMLCRVKPHRGLRVRGTLRWVCGYFQHTR